jgi:hypothetical protein
MQGCYFVASVKYSDIVVITSVQCVVASVDNFILFFFANRLN